MDGDNRLIATMSLSRRTDKVVRDATVLLVMALFCWFTWSTGPQTPSGYIPLSQALPTTSLRRKISTRGKMGIVWNFFVIVLECPGERALVK
jgi:hypothetical protein